MKAKRTRTKFETHRSYRVEFDSFGEWQTEQSGLVRKDAYTLARSMRLGNAKVRILRVTAKVEVIG